MPYFVDSDIVCWVKIAYNLASKFTGSPKLGGRVVCYALKTEPAYLL
jgi:hypothetical protein